MINYYYTDSQKKKLLKSLVFLVDTREQANKHILDYFEAKKLNYKTRALTSGDYSVMIPQNPDLGIMLDMYLQSKIFIERKNSLEELASNLGKNRDRFEAEMVRGNGAEKHLIVEGGSWKQIMKGEYNSLVTAVSFYNSLMAFQTRYGLHIHFVDKETIAPLIRGILENKVKEILHE